MTYQPLQPSPPEYLYEFLKNHLVPPVRAVLEVAGPGQRIRITTLPGIVMEDVCAELQGDERWVARVLVIGEPARQWQSTATKLIELRNTLERPLVVFIPPEAKTTAEDSLEIATFRELSLSTSVTSDLISSLIRALPPHLSPTVSDILDYARREKLARNEDDLVTYLLTLHWNGATQEAAGGALFVFGLIPHFGLYAQTNVPYWLSRNRKMQQLLSDVRQPVQSRITRLPLEPNTIQQSLFTFLRARAAQDSREWAVEIGCEIRSQAFALDNWPFVESADDTQLRIRVEPLTLPVQPADEVGGTTPLPVLNLDGREGLKVSFRAVPAPPDVTAWKTYRIQLVQVDEDQPNIAWESNGFKKPAGRQKVNRTIRVSDLSALEEGTYYARVEAYDNDGALLILPRRLDPSDTNSRAENESEYFLVVREGVEVVATPQRAVDMPSLVTCWIEANVRSLTLGSVADVVIDRNSVTGVWAEPIGSTVKGDSHFKLEGEGVAGFTVVVPSLLRSLELTILGDPDQLGRFYLDLSKARDTADIEIKRAAGETTFDVPALREFCESRRKVFELILNQHKSRLGERAQDATCKSLVETTDLPAISEAIIEYGSLYLTLLKAAFQKDRPSREQGLLFKTLAALDVTELRWRPTPNDPGRALLIAPTHPLRLVWHLQHFGVCESMLLSWREKTAAAPSWQALLRSLTKDILPTNVPMVLFDRKGRAYVEQGLLTNHWSLYLPDRSDRSTHVDVIAAREACRRLLDIKGAAPITATVGGEDIASRVFEYLQQHPYVEQLKINVFNPGDGQLITDALRDLERMRLGVSPGSEAPPLRYSVQMFGSPSQVETMGEAFESLLDPERQVAEDDEFTLTPSNHLVPKLIFARNPVEDFAQRPAEFSAHLTLLIEQFGSQARLGQLGPSRGSYVGGLVQEPETTLGRRDASLGWYKGLRARGSGSPLAGELLLTEILASTQRLQAAAATGEVNAPDVAPLVALRLESEEQGLLRLMHTYSDWVLTIDRNLGLEYFDSPSSSSDAGYLLDYTPEFLQEDRQRILLTTKSDYELQSVVRPTVEKFGLSLPPGRESAVLDALRSLSGRLALKLISLESNAAEVVGLLLARWLMEQSGVLEGRIVIPLDAHRGWFKADEDGTLMGRRADLLLVTLDPSRQLVKCGVVEVKFREELTATGRSALYQDMHAQAEATERRLRELFDPQLYSTPRADLALRSKELMTALSFYARRAARYGLLPEERLRGALNFIESLDGGYSLDISLMGVVFDRRGVGAHMDEEESGFGVHRFGLDVAQRLINRACGEYVEDTSSSTGGLTPVPRVVEVIHVVPRPDEFLSSFRSTVEGISTRHPAVSQGQQRDTPATTAVESPAPPEGQSLMAPDRPTPEDGSQTAAQQDETAGRTTDADVGLVMSTPTPEISSGGGQGIDDTATSRAQEDAEQQPADTQRVHTSPEVGTLLGSHEYTPQFGVLGRYADAALSIDLTGCNTISLFGVQGFGKSYTLGVIAEMATTAVQGINVLPAPLATVIFHYHKSDAYAPEFASATEPNNKAREVDRLLREYGARPQRLSDVVLLTPEAKIAERREEFPGLEVRPIKFSSGELGAESWKFLLGAYGNDSLYVRQLVAIMRRHREDLTLKIFREEVQAADLSQQARRLAEDRLTLAEQYIDDSVSLGALIRPGRTIIVDLRDPWIEKDEALGLFVVMMRIFASVKHGGRPFNKLVIFDEAHKYISESDLIGQVVETIREMRHQATSVVIASQDPLSVPRSIVELTSILIMHRMTSPQWLRHLKSAISALQEVSESQLATLQAGDALVWAQRSTDKRFTQRPYKVQIRPRFSLHGGGTKTAVPDATVR